MWFCTTVMFSPLNIFSKTHEDFLTVEQRFCQYCAAIIADHILSTDGQQAYDLFNGTFDILSVILCICQIIISKLLVKCIAYLNGSCILLFALMRYTLVNTDSHDEDNIYRHVRLWEPCHFYRADYCVTENVGEIGCFYIPIFSHYTINGLNTDLSVMTLPRCGAIREIIYVILIS